MVDVSESLPSLIRRPGLTKWLPTVGRDLKYLETYEDYIASLPGGKGTARLARSHWPPAEELGLERWYAHSAERFWLLIKDSIRIYPHLQDTGGFFVAVLQHRRTESTAVPKYKVASRWGPRYSILGTREGKRTADEEAEEPNVKKARLNGDEDVVMEVTELSTSKCTSHLMQTHDRH